MRWVKRLFDWLMAIVVLGLTAGAVYLSFKLEGKTLGEILFR